MAISLETKQPPSKASPPPPAPGSARAASAVSAAPASPEGGLAPAASRMDAVSPEEGAALIRAFLKIRQREVRTALIELALSLGTANRPAS